MGRISLIDWLFEVFSSFALQTVVLPRILYVSSLGFALKPSTYDTRTEDPSVHMNCCHSSSISILLVEETRPYPYSTPVVTRSLFLCREQ